MKPYIALFLVLFLHSTLHAQSDVSLIATTGVGRIKALPDQAEVNFNVISTGMDYNAVLRDLNKKVNRLESEISKAGFPKEALKTQAYSIDRHYVYENGKRIDSGYIGRQSLLLTFPYEEQRVVKLISGISKGAPDASFNFGFSMSDRLRDSLKTKLLELAFKDAEVQAKALASAAGIQLQEIKSITPVPDRSGPVMHERMAMAQAQDSEEFSGFNRQEQELTQDIRVEWVFSQ